MEEAVEVRIGKRLVELGQWVATGESCTGGLIAHRITNVAGASAYYRGGVVAYSNEAKVRLLGVREADIARWGAVNETVARQMAEGARARFEADWALGVTGIAGPTGGTSEKPVGLVYMAVAGKDGLFVTRHLFSGTRDEIKEQGASRALALLWERLR